MKLKYFEKPEAWTNSQKASWKPLAALTIHQSSFNWLTNQMLMSDSAHARQSLLRAFCRSWVLNMNLFALDFVSKWEHWLRFIIWMKSKNSILLQSCACLPSAQRVRAQSSQLKTLPEPRLWGCLFTSLQGLLFTKLQVSSLSALFVGMQSVFLTHWVWSVCLFLFLI